jgi:hypothetical protein
MGVMIYALVIYQSRARAIRKRTGAPYDDRLGPVSVVVWHERVVEGSLIAFMAMGWNHKPLDCALSLSAR